jgi:hypothetical protein
VLALKFGIITALVHLGNSYTREYDESIVGSKVLDQPSSCEYPQANSNNTKNGEREPYPNQGVILRGDIDVADIHYALGS